MFSDILGKEKYGVNAFIDKTWRVNSRIMKCGDIQIREILLFSDVFQGGEKIAESFRVFWEESGIA